TLLFELVLNSFPINGRSPKKGILLTLLVSFSDIKPPSIMVSPSFNLTVESSTRVLIVGGTLELKVPTGVLNSGVISTVTSPEALTHGTIDSLTLASTCSNLSD